VGVKNLSQLLKDNPKFQVVKDKDLDDFKDQTLAFDAFNVLYQFLSTIRDERGQTLSDSEGRVTSHLIGILTRNSQLLQKGIKPVWIFDGKSHELKKETIEQRSEIKKEAEIQYKEALKDGDLERAKSLASRVSRLDEKMVDDSKKLLETMGIPVIQAPSEGEAQAAQLTREGKVSATASQDFDSLLFGSPVLVRNLNISGKRTIRGRVVTINPQEIHLQDVLQGLEINQDQLIDLGILLGTDFNPDGFPGIGPKTAYNMIKKHHNFLEIQKHESKVLDVEFHNYEVIKKIFSQPNVEKGLSFKFGKYNPDKILEFLVEERGFSKDRHEPLIRKTAREIENIQKQSTLEEFF
jgi:flap endonuclease-1